MNEYPSATRNVALLIDADNASHHAIDPVLTVLAELGSVNVRRAYGNWRKDGLKGWMDKSMKHGIEPHQQFDITKGKNATDMKMTIDAMDLLFRGRIDGFGIMSSDSDFMPLAMRIRQDGIPVYGFGDTKTPDSFKQACSRFIDVGALLRDVKPRPLPATVPTPAPAPVPTDVPIEQAIPPAVGTTPRAPAAAPAVGPALVLPASTSTKADFDPEVLQLLIDAYDASKRDQRGFVSLSAMGQLAANRSSFDVRNYGYKRLSDLIESVPNFQIERREDGRAMVRRLR